MSTLLFIDDDQDLLDINKKLYSRSGYKVITCNNSLNAIEITKSSQVDCIILDIMMPGSSGFDVCKEIRNFSDTPIIFLSGLSSEDEKVQGLLIGGDDYMVKPYSTKELNARIQVQLRKKNNIINSNNIVLTDMIIDIESHKAYWRKEELRLSNNEYTFLRLLCTTPNKIISFEMLGKAIWNNYLPDDRKTIMVIASRLRRKLSTYTKRDNLIETVRLKGYKYIYRS